MFQQEFPPAPSAFLPTCFFSRRGPHLLHGIVHVLSEGSRSRGFVSFFKSGPFSVKRFQAKMERFIESNGKKKPGKVKQEGVRKGFNDLKTCRVGLLIHLHCLAILKIIICVLAVALCLSPNVSTYFQNKNAQKCFAATRQVLENTCKYILCFYYILARIKTQKNTLSCLNPRNAPESSPQVDLPKSSVPLSQSVSFLQKNAKPNLFGSQVSC